MQLAIAAVRFSLQSDNSTRNELNKTLVGHATKPTGKGPFERVGTGCYVAQKCNVHDAVIAIHEAMGIVVRKRLSLDHVLVTLAVRNPLRATTRRLIEGRIPELD